MTKVAGQQLESSSLAISLEGDGSGDPGDFVAINSGQVTTADGTTDTNVIGILTDRNDPAADREAGDKVSVGIGGVFVGNVASGVSAGVELGAGSTEGQAASGSGAGNTLSDEGGQYRGSTAVPSGTAAVHLG